MTAAAWNYISRQNTIVQKSLLSARWSGAAPRRGRLVSDVGRPPVGGRFIQPERTPFYSVSTTEAGTGPSVSELMVKFRI